ncbi:hypothetical protein ACHAQJ_005135 [Trichoderma viride]
MSASSPPPAATSLSPLLPILNAFNHRHHNQHRLAHWWPVFRILRRTIRNLIDDLTPPSTSLSSRPARREEAPSPPSRAVWLNKHFIPRAYVAFSQLAADNQHAPLGLLLLAILSRVHAVVSQLLLIDNVNPPTSIKSQSSTHRSNDLTNQDKGVAVARRDLMPLTKSTLPSTERLQTPTQSASDEQQAIKPSKKKPKEASSLSKEKKKKKKEKGDALSSLFGSLA